MQLLDLDDRQFDALMAVLDEVQAEYRREYAKFGLDALGRPDPLEDVSYRHRTNTAERIRTEIIVRSGRLPEGSTF
jgi:hypothetical protein